MNQPPLTEKQTGKRIVSKGEYVVTIGKKVALSGFGGTVFLIGLATLVVSCVGMIKVLQHSHWSDLSAFLSDSFTFLASILLLIGGPIVLLCFGVAAIKEVKETDSGIPFTRANTADLPAPDSLVRASEEPVQKPQAVLLRAATESVERHEEQLVRAAGQE